MTTKTCSRCKIEQPSENFTGRDSYCRPCRREKSREYAKTHPERLVAATMRWIDRNREKFNAYQKELKQRPHVREKKKAQMRRWWNSEKGQKWSKDYRKENRHAINDSQNKWSAKNRGKVRSYKKKYWSKYGQSINELRRNLRKENPEYFRTLDNQRRKENVELKRDQAKKRYWNNPEHYREALRKSYKRNREKRISDSIAIRAKRAGAKGSHTIAEWKCVLRHYKRRCVYCGIKLTNKNISRDHVHPLSKGGTNDIKNIVPACRPCNSSKNARIITGRNL